MVWGLVRFEHGALKPSEVLGLPRNYQYIRLTGACGGREGGKFGSRTEGANEVRWKGTRFNGGGSLLRVDALNINSLRADALEHLCKEARVLTIRASNSSRLSLHRCMLTKAAIGFRFDCRGVK